jgi:uncharacterized C2H2 Zn-finger protein
VVRCRVVKGSLSALVAGDKWVEVVHRDDVHAWLFGRSVELKVGKAPDPAEKGIKVQVGVMEATVKAGADGKLGTDDDEVTITPTTKIDGVVEYDEGKDDEGKKIFTCTACRITRRTKKSMVKHIERDH